MAKKYPIPVNVTFSEKGAPKIISSKARLDEVGANAFIVSKATMKKLEAPADEGGVDVDKAANLILTELGSLPAGVLPRGAAAAIKRGLDKLAD